MKKWNYLLVEIDGKKHLWDRRFIEFMSAACRVGFYHYVNYILPQVEGLRILGKLKK